MAFFGNALFGSSGTYNFPDNFEVSSTQRMLIDGGISESSGFQKRARSPEIAFEAKVWFRKFQLSEHVFEAHAPEITLISEDRIWEL